MPHAEGGNRQTDPDRSDTLGEHLILVYQKFQDIAQHVILLSGTPALSRPVELFTQIKMINPLICPNWNAYASRYCNLHKQQIGGRFIMDAKGQSNPEELRALMDKLMIRLRIV